MSIRSVLLLAVGCFAVTLAVLQGRDNQAASATVAPANADGEATPDAEAIIVASSDVPGDGTPSQTLSTSPSGAGVTIRRGADGHFRSDAGINGRRIVMMIDSGASLVTLTERDAQLAGINPAPDSYTGRARTAGGEVPFARVTIDRVTLGGIEQRNVEAAVMRGNALPQSLLGQSFLAQVAEMRIADGEMRLR